jgi:chemotaxis protein MotA
MDKTTIGGLILAWGCLITAILLDKADLRSFMKLAPAILVFGGTFGAVLIGISLREVKQLPKKIAKSFINREPDFLKVIGMMVEFATKSRRDGVLSLEDSIETIDDEFMKKGLQLVVDGVDLDQIRDTMEQDIASLEQWYGEATDFFQQLGGFSPTLGIIGTVLGLIQMLSELENAESMGPAIASAFIATMYGVSAANLIYLPLGNKTKKVAAKDILEKRMILEGLICIQAGKNPRLTEQALLAFIYPEKKPEGAAAAPAK